MGNIKRSKLFQGISVSLILKYGRRCYSEIKSVFQWITHPCSLSGKKNITGTIAEVMGCMPGCFERTYYDFSSLDRVSVSNILYRNRNDLPVHFCKLAQCSSGFFPQFCRIDHMTNPVRMTDDLRVRVVLQQQSGTACVVNMDMSQENVIYLLDPTRCQGIQKDGNRRSGAGIYNDRTITVNKYPAADKIPESLYWLIQIHQVEILHGSMNYVMCNVHGKTFLIIINFESTPRNPSPPLLW